MDLCRIVTLEGGTYLKFLLWPDFLHFFFSSRWVKMITCGVNSRKHPSKPAVKKSNKWKNTSQGVVWGAASAQDWGSRVRLPYFLVFVSGVGVFTLRSGSKTGERRMERAALNVNEARCLCVWVWRASLADVDARLPAAAVLQPGSVPTSSCPFSVSVGCALKKTRKRQSGGWMGGWVDVHAF